MADVETKKTPLTSLSRDDAGSMLSRQLAGRLSAALYVASGLVTLASLGLPSAPDLNRPGIAGVALIAIVIGTVNWFLPWERWPRTVGLAWVPLAFVLIAFHNHFGGADPYRYGLFFIVVFLWIGLSQRPWTSLLFIPLFAAAYVIPLYTSGHQSPAAVSSVVYTLPVCLLVGESTAWISARLSRAQQALRRSEVRFRSLVQNATDLIIVVDKQLIIHYASPSALRFFGKPPNEVLGTAVVAWLHPDDAAGAAARLGQRAQMPGSGQPVEVRYRGADGTWRYAEAVATNLLDDPAIGGLVINARDISDRKQFEDELAHQAFHDPLTGLPNRVLLRDRLEHALARSARLPRSVALLFLDLDNFKIINDSLGHDVGDQLLMAVARRLQDNVRQGDTASRFGGDEFAILLDEVDSVGAAGETAQRIIRALEAPFTVAGHELFVTVCIGVAMGRAPDGPDDLLRNADAAMYRAKANGKARYEVFDPTMHTRARERLALERDLRRAVERHELRLFYQPMVDFATGRVTEVEALVRWQHPARGLISPADFIPVAEETGLIVPIGRWVIEEACRQLRAWQDAHPTATDLTVSVNLSPRQFHQPDLADVITQALHAAGIAPSCLRIEITESMMMEDTEATAATLRALKQIGIRLAVDDFGTGYSSLAYLKRFPTDALKIDRSFVHDVASNREDRALVRAMIAAARALNLRVTAEGIETEAQVTHLRLLGCDSGQGFLFARPMPASALGGLLSAPLLVRGAEEPPQQSALAGT